jgi:hypothetical protein
VTEQPKLFEDGSAHGRPPARAAAAAAPRLALYALGEFQSRGKALAERELPLDRLRGALRRAAEVLGVAEPGDEQAVAALEAVGARVRRVPPYVAKHPFRVTAPSELAERASVLEEFRLFRHGSSVSATRQPGGAPSSDNPVRR